MSIHAYTLNPRTTPESRVDDAYVPHGLGDPDGSLPDRWFSGTTTADIHAFLDSGLDLLVVALPLTDLTRGLLGRDEFAILAKRRTFLSNIARGAIVDTDALLEALHGEQLSGAALDVTDPRAAAGRPPAVGGQEHVHHATHQRQLYAVPGTGPGDSRAQPGAAADGTDAITQPAEQAGGILKTGSVIVLFLDRLIESLYISTCPVPACFGRWPCQHSCKLLGSAQHKALRDSKATGCPRISWPMVQAYIS